jgi:hypothetical protein
MYSHYAKKYKFKPLGELNSSKGATTKPPLGTINGSITSTGVTSFKDTRSREDVLVPNRENSAGSYRSNESTNNDAKGSSSLRGYVRDNKKPIASKLSATLPKSAVYKKYSGGTTYKSGSMHKKQISGNKIQVYSNSHREYKNTNYNSMINNTVTNRMSPSGLRTGKYSKIPKGISKVNSSHNDNVDGNISNLRVFEPSTSPFRMDTSSGSLQKTHLARKPASGGYVQTFAPKPVSYPN